MSKRFDWDWDREWDNWESERRRQEEWHRMRERDRERPDYPVDKTWLPENQGVQPGGGQWLPSHWSAAHSRQPTGADRSAKGR